MKLMKCCEFVPRTIYIFSFYESHEFNKQEFNQLKILMNSNQQMWKWYDFGDQKGAFILSNSQFWYNAQIIYELNWLIEYSLLYLPKFVLQKCLI